MRTSEKWIWVFAAVATTLVACSSRSLWIDEFMTLRVSGEPTFAALVSNLSTNAYTEAQMPVYIGYLWGWIRLFGSSELSLHLANAPWLIVGVTSIFYWVSDVKHARWAIVLMLVSPFLWYYLDEARPYAMQAGASAAMLGLVWRVCEKRRQKLDLDWRDAAVFGFGAVVCSGASMLGVLWLISSLGLFLYLTIRKEISWKMEKSLVTVLSVTTALLGVLALYYLSTLARGAGPALKHQSLILEFGFAAYEHLGFAGLGPPRNDLREFGVSAFSLKNLSVVVLLICYTTIAIGGIFANRGFRRSTNWLGLLFVVALPCFALAALSEATGFRVLGRHIAPVLPLVVLGVAAVIVALPSQSFFRVIPVMMVAVLLCSSCVLRFVTRYGDDDYRGASLAAKNIADSGERTGWLANESGLEYYLGGKKDRSDRIEMIDVAKFKNMDGGTRDLPRTVIFSKPDIYDPSGLLTKELLSRGYTHKHLTRAFDLWAPKNSEIWVNFQKLSHP